ncbi:glycosyltransferase [Hoeflea sp. WL0058]|uniref:Glycosyltransferase n=1 Tax=Flavimaribacter sediminis TaxID=2865987 RepID=A0AAE3CZH4_9HYPH|nr:cellulose synthase catalytic subunit [Flavimaribacter sediminis]MBW8635828.1 glycosyltransferase [Flavimaribacter sediminis]
MESFIYLSHIQSSFLLLLLPVAAAFIVPSFARYDNNWHRALLLSISAVLSLRYAWWRGAETLAPLGLTWDCAASWSLYFLEILTIIATLSSYMIMSRTRNRSGEVQDNLAWWSPGPAPKVAVLIATYNEESDVLERTILGAKAMDYPSFEVLVLYDGKRDWLRDYCADHKVRYLRRPDNKGAKAGNINNALDVLAGDDEPPAFIAILDADFVPRRNFLSHTVALFHEPDVGLVQTPQHFFNADPIQHNLGLSRSYPDEQRFFFDHLQPSRDGWGIAFCCGTSSVTRWQALREIGGMQTDSVTEDFLLTLVLQDHGWRTAYLSEPLSEGLAPEGLKEYVGQRARWCLGLMQIARSRWGPTGASKLRWRDRWSVTDAMLFWLTTYPFRVAAMVYPLLYWYFNIIVVDARPADVISYFGLYYLWSLVVLNYLSRGTVVPMVIDVSQLIAAIPITRAAIVGLFKPQGHPFSVTAKGGDRSSVTAQWRMMTPFVIILALTYGGLFIGIFSDQFAYYDAGTGKAVILFWSFYNVIALSITITVCFELPRRERHVMDAPERATIRIGEREPNTVWLAGLTQDRARIRGHLYKDGEQGLIQIAQVGEVVFRVVGQTDDGATLSIEPDDAQYAALIRKFYTQGPAPGVTRTRFGAFVEDLARRFSFSTGR